MIKNCFIQMYKGDTNNNELPVYAQTVIYAAVSGTGYFNLVADEANKVKATVTNGTVNSVGGGGTKISDTEFYLGSASSSVAAIVPTDNTKPIVIATDGRYRLVKIENAIPAPLADVCYSKLSAIILNNANYMDVFEHIKINTDELINLINPELMTTWDVALNNAHSSLNENITGTLSPFVRMVNLTKLHIGYTAILGEFKELGGLTKLTDIDLSSTNIEGSVEEFVQAQRLAGRTATTGTDEGITVKYGFGLKVTFNGTTSYSVAANAKLTWTATTITYNGVTINA